MLKILRYFSKFLVALLAIFILWIGAPFILAISKLKQEECLYCPVSRAHIEYQTSPNFYSQDNEDYILSYIFKDIQQGFYVDIGANDPNLISVTKYFYERGWNGINIDANPNFKPLYERFRPKDTNLFIGISNKQSTIDFYNLIGVNALSTFERDIAEVHAAKNGYKIQTIKVPVRTLNSVLDEYRVKQITFMTIDVEGHERQVLESLNFQKYRPSVLLIESTYPCTQVPVYDKWEEILLQNDYKYVIFDGLNRYYLDKRLPNFKELSARFSFMEQCLRQVKLIKKNKWAKVIVDVMRKRHRDSIEKSQ